jgi:hypothetical protein
MDMAMEKCEIVDFTNGITIGRLKDVCPHKRIIAPKLDSARMLEVIREIETLKKSESEYAAFRACISLMAEPVAKRSNTEAIAIVFTAVLGMANIGFAASNAIAASADFFLSIMIGNIATLTVALCLLLLTARSVRRLFEGKEKLLKRQFLEFCFHIME